MNPATRHVLTAAVLIGLLLVWVEVKVQVKRGKWPRRAEVVSEWLWYAAATYAIADSAGWALQLWR